ncbi:MAG: murein biosynthesis integral membrane protein MurJ [candidate division WOR-3 bacterium]|nr:murein biosynthesis integral membrane protein MurJ [candidate division WOR-3 bacterium]MDW8113710.1 murein biosynthesis integral membrane protein MurJ [candidate division WOR-3 bacterium]
MLVNGKLNLKKLIFSESIFLSSGIMVIGLVLSKFLGFLREVFVAKVFGVSYLCDAYLIAILFPISIMGAVSQAIGVSLIPIFSKKDFNLYYLYLLIISFFSLLISFIIYLSPSIIINIIGQGFPFDIKETSKFLLKNMAPAIFFIGISGFFNAFSYVNKNYLFPSLSGILYNLCLIFGLTILYKNFNLLGLSWGVNLASLLFILFPLLFFLKRKPLEKNLNLSKALFETKILFLSFLPYLLISSLSQINVAIDKMIASFLNEGSVSALNFAYKIVEAPISIFGFALATVLMPFFSEKVYNGEKEKIIETLNKSLSSLLFIIIPITFIFLWAGEIIVKIVYFRGAFDEKSLIMTKEALIFYSLGLFAYCSNLILIRVYWSINKIKIPIIVSIFALFLNLILNIILSKFFSYKGLALATSLSGIFRFALLLLFLQTYFQTNFQFAKSLLKPVLAIILKIKI